MRRLILAVTAVAALAGGGSLASTSADALPLGQLGVVGRATAGQVAPEKVHLVCRRVWDGYGWVRRCYQARPRYYDEGPRYYGGGPTIHFGFGHHGGGHHGFGHHGGGHHFGHHGGGHHGGGRGHH